MIVCSQPECQTAAGCKCGQISIPWPADLIAGLNARIESDAKRIAELEAERDDLKADYLRRHKDACDRFEEVASLQRALAEERHKHQWRTIDSAPKDREIMVAGGTYYSTADDWLTEYPCETWHLAYWDGDGWRGEPDEQYDTFKFYRPTHWMEKIALPDATAIRSGKTDGKE